jgi:hypothetical protein
MESWLICRRSSCVRRHKPWPDSKLRPSNVFFGKSFVTLCVFALENSVLIVLADYSGLSPVCRQLAGASWLGLHRGPKTFRQPLRPERPCCVWSYLSWALYAVWGEHNSHDSVCSAFVVGCQPGTYTHRKSVVDGALRPGTAGKT